MLSKDEQITLKRVDAFIVEYFQHEQSGHDYHHIKRVVNLTARLMPVDDSSRFLALLIAYFHDVFDDKVNPTDDLNQVLRSLFLKWDLDFGHLTDEIILGVSQIGYKGGFGVKDKTYAAQFVSDADFLDAMGAIGIARTFYYAGTKGTPLYNPDLEGVAYHDLHEYRSTKRNAIAHFDEKLLKLKDLLYTSEGKRLGQQRHEMLETFYEAFYENVALDDIDAF